MKKQPFLALRDFLCSKKFDVYIPKMEKQRYSFETGEFIGGYKYPPNRVIDLRNKKV